MTLSLCLFDFETASACDLKKCGSWRYAEDLTTEIICLAFAETMTEVPAVWLPTMGPDHPISQRLLRLVLDPNVTFVAHNVGFEKAIWRRIMVKLLLWPDIPNSRWHDTLAVCAMKSLPQDLDGAARVLRLPFQKDREGSALTKSLSKPDKKTGYYDRSPETLARVYTYCQSDIKSEFALLDRVGFIPPGERRVWLLDQRINERGVRLDVDYIRQAQTIVTKASVPLAAEFRDLTGGLSFTQRDKIMSWLIQRGVNLPNMTKDTLASVLGPLEEDADDFEADPGALDIELPTEVRRALRIRQLIGSASVKKLGRMEACVNEDGRARGLLQYHGAGPGRWAGRILQPHNFPRGSLELGGEPPSPELVYQAIMSGDPEWVEIVLGPPVEAVVSGLRHSLIPDPDRVYVSGDFTQVELRVLLALAGQMDKVELLASGGKPYQDMAQLIFHRPIDKHNDVKEYTIGKNSVLGQGFQMGAAKFHSRYAPEETMETCEEVTRIYRKEWAPMVPKLWYALEAAAIRTVHENRPYEAYGVMFQLEDGWLTARLPSGRKLWYRNPRACRKAVPWDPTDVRPAYTYEAQKMGRWITVEAFGGLITENVVQGLARDLLVWAMFKAEASGFPLVLTVHDEILAEPLRADADMEALKQLMCEIPDWARAMNVPIAAEMWTGDRYRK